MSAGQIEVVVTLTNDKVQFEGISKSNPDRPVAFDYLPPLGDGQGFLGLEMLVMSFTGCVSTGMVFLLRRMGKNISSFKVNAAGSKREKPLSLEKITLEVVLESDNTTDAEMQSVINKAQEISPVWIAIKNNVEVAVDYKIIVP